MSAIIGGGGGAKKTVILQNGQVTTVHSTNQLGGYLGKLGGIIYSPPSPTSLMEVGSKISSQIGTVISKQPSVTPPTPMILPPVPVITPTITMPRITPSIPTPMPTYVPQAPAVTYSAPTTQAQPSSGNATVWKLGLGLGPLLLAWVFAKQIRRRRRIRGGIRRVRRYFRIPRRRYRRARRLRR